MTTPIKFMRVPHEVTGFYDEVARSWILFIKLDCGHNVDQQDVKRPQLKDTYPCYECELEHKPTDDHR
jgi:hypothetical protein